MNGKVAAPLSARAQKLYARVQQGHFYRAYEDRLPKAMKELEAHGLVSIAGRVVVTAACYVPTSGYTPHVNEKFDR
ncbi:MAG: hypothetical protein KYX69_19855 [Sphingomonas sp.]|uniref:hypothetical protein n=1 Tax=Sphingomonas sp. TaxID=28214 RepID=UPI00260F8A63|nr:hypothetical protein [Sphingomonas sp.]MDK2769960.1 hypothetical protein [Sphingomonas sp.]